MGGEMWTSERVPFVKRKRLSYLFGGKLLCAKFNTVNSKFIDEYRKFKWNTNFMVLIMVCYMYWPRIELSWLNAEIGKNLCICMRCAFIYQLIHCDVARHANEICNRLKASGCLFLSLFYPIPHSISKASRAALSCKCICVNQKKNV